MPIEMESRQLLAEESKATLTVSPDPRPGERCPSPVKTGVSGHRGLLAEEELIASAGESQTVETRLRLLRAFRRTKRRGTHRRRGIGSRAEAPRGPTRPVVAQAGGRRTADKSSPAQMKFLPRTICASRCSWRIRVAQAVDRRQPDRCKSDASPVLTTRWDEFAPVPGANVTLVVSISNPWHVRDDDTASLSKILGFIILCWNANDG